LQTFHKARYRSNSMRLLVVTISLRIVVLKEELMSIILSKDLMLAAILLESRPKTRTLAQELIP